MARSGADPAPRRVLVTGPPGSGKTTLGRELGRRFDLPVTHLDRLYWNAGWVPSSPETMRERVAPVVAGPAWVIEGNYSGTYDLRIPHADLIVFLDLPRRTTLPAILRRWWQHRGGNRSDLPPGCPEKLDVEFAVWSWRWRRNSRPKLVSAIAAAGAAGRLVHLTRRRDVRRWLDTVATTKR